MFNSAFQPNSSPSHQSIQPCGTNAPQRRHQQHGEHRIMEADIVIGVGALRDDRDDLAVAVSNSALVTAVGDEDVVRLGQLHHHPPDAPPPPNEPPPPEKPPPPPPHEPPPLPQEEPLLHDEPLLLPSRCCRGPGPRSPPARCRPRRPRYFRPRMPADQRRDEDEAEHRQPEDQGPGRSAPLEPPLFAASAAASARCSACSGGACSCSMIASAPALMPPG